MKTYYIELRHIYADTPRGEIYVTDKDAAHAITAAARFFPQLTSAFYYLNISFICDGFPL